MKVGVFLDEYQPRDGGGYTMQTELFRALCELATQSAHEFVIISSAKKEVASEAKAAGLGWLAFRDPGILERVSAVFSRAWPSMRNRLLWRSSFELSARRAGIEFVWFLGPRPVDIDLPYLTIVLDLQHRKQPWFPEVSEFSEWETRERRLAPFLRRAAGIITGTQAGRDEVTHFYQIPEDRIHILPHPTPAYAMAERKQNELPHGLKPGFLFYPAQFWAHKNHVNLILAVKQLRNEGLNNPLVLAGSDFGNQAHVKNTIDLLGLQDQVTMLGFIDKEELVALYQNALALTYVSFFGPENLPPLEAFGLGCPVIAARVSGAEEQLGDAALLVDPGDPQDIASAIRKLHADEPLRAQMIADGRERAAQWTSKDFVRGAFEILDKFESVRRTWKN
ncbi:MAG: glycosyltransferase family 1 protein [Sedimentisphaerales bacterium]|nr:glycosyltransferase family 1 protein [Sedimentisphaerales bacterium]